MKFSKSKNKIRKTLVFPEESHSSVKMVETAVNQHFAHLHGVLQNVERRMIDKLYDQRNDLTVNLSDIQQRLKTHEDQLQSTLQMAATVNAIIDKINLKDVIVELERLADVPCHLVQDPIVDDEKIVFCPDPSIIQILENHCRIEIPKVSGYNLLPNNTVSTDYEAESLSRQELPNGRDESFCSNTPLMKRASSCQSLCSRRSEARHLREGGTCLVNVCYVQNPSNFYVRQVSYQDQLRKLDQKITSYAKRSIHVPSEVHPNDLYIVKRADKNKWYRGRVNAVNTIAGAPDTYEVFNVDYGLTETQVPSSRMRRIPGDLATTPQMAINCSLYDIVPIDGKWRTPARKLFFDIVKRKPDHAVTLHISSVKGNTYYVDICEEPLIDGQGSQTSVRDALVFLGHGAFVDSQYLRRTCPLSVRKFLREDMYLETYSYVMCSYVESPDCIYVQKAGEHLHFLCTLTNDISKHYKHMKYKSKVGSTGHIPEIGQPCAVENAEGQWHRGTISRVPRARMVEVFLVDFGSTITTPYDRIQKLHERFMMYPTQAIKVTLADIKPRGSEWCEEAIQFTKRNVEHKYARVFAFEQTESGYNVAFYVGDEDNRKNLSALLVAGGLAVGTGPRSMGQAEVSINQSSQRSSKAKVRNSRTTKAKKFNANCYALTTKSSASDVSTADPYKLPVKIVRVVSPDTIYVCDTSLEKEYEQMMMEMQTFYNKYKDVSNKCDWQLNYPCAVYSSRDRCFCRGEITAFKSSDEVQVFLYDLALTETVPISELQALKKKFWITPTYVCKVKLAGILPCGGSSVWPSSSCEKLKDHISENHHAKFYISKVVTPGEDELNVDLWVEEIKIDGPLSPARIELNSISRMLVDTGLALPIKQYNEKKTKVLAIELKRQLSCTDESSKNDTFDWTANGDFKERRSIIATPVKSIENDESFESSAASSMSDDQSEDATSFLDSSTSTEDSFVLSAQTLTSTEPKLVAWLPAEPILDNKFVAVPTNLDHDCCVHLHSKSQSDSVLRFIATTLHDEYSNLKVGPWDLEWEEGEICVAQWHGNKKWYRAQVVRILDNMIEVEFVDYGSVEECENGTLRKRLTLTHIPRQSTKCVISGLLPNTPNGKWRTHDLDKIHNLLVEKECEVSVMKRKPDHLVVSINLLTPTRCELVSYLINEVRMDVQPDFVDPGYSNDETESTIENSCDVIVVGYVKNPVSEAENSENNEEKRLSEKEKNIENNEENILSEKEKNIENNEDGNEKTENNDAREKIDKKGEDEIHRNEENENGEVNDFSVITDLPNTVSAPQLKEVLPYFDDCTLSMENIINLNYKSDDVAISGTANFTLSADQIEISQREAMGKLESQSFLDCNSLNEGEIITSTPFNDSLALAPKGYQSLALPKDVKVVKAEVVLIGLTKAWLHLLDNETSEIISKLRNLYEKIMQDMQDCANEQPLLKNFEKNTPCCAKFVDDKWYRCKVVECGSDPYELREMVQVRFVDWGNTDSIRRDEVRTLKDEWFDAPCMAFRCRLWRVVENPTAESESVRQKKVRKAWRVGETPPRPVYVKIEGHSGAFYDVQIYTDEECTELIYQSLIDDGLFLNKLTKGD